MTAYIVATTKPWNKAAFLTRLRLLDGEWTLATDPDSLERLVQHPYPRYIFFPHWNWKIPPHIYDSYECIAFHATALPFGRGGSPIQNMIQRGHPSTTITAFRVTGELDAGPIYDTKPLSLVGGGEEIFMRFAHTTADMIEDIVAVPRIPMAQRGEATTFKRRTPAQSEIQGRGLPALPAIHDRIRMLDAEGYPRAFLERGSLRFEFRNSVLRQGRVEALVEITVKEDD